MTLEQQLEDLARMKWMTYRGMARRIVHHREDAEDMVQHAFLLAFQNLDRFKGDAQLGSWVGSIVKNCCLMKLRRDRRKCVVNVVRLEDVEWKALDLTTPDYLSQIEEERKQRALYEQIKRLPRHMKRLIEARLEGASLKEVSARYDMPIGTVKSYLCRGRDRLAQRLLA